MELEIILTKLRPLKLSHFGSFLHFRVKNLFNQLLEGFLMDVSQTLKTYHGRIENVHVGVLMELE